MRRKNLCFSRLTLFSRSIGLRLIPLRERLSTTRLTLLAMRRRRLLFPMNMTSWCPWLEPRAPTLIRVMTWPAMSMKSLPTRLRTGWKSLQTASATVSSADSTPSWRPSMRRKIWAWPMMAARLSRRWIPSFSSVIPMAPRLSSAPRTISRIRRWKLSVTRRIPIMCLTIWLSVSLEILIRTRWSLWSRSISAIGSPTRTFRNTM